MIYCLQLWQHVICARCISAQSLEPRTRISGSKMENCQRDRSRDFLKDDGRPVWIRAVRACDDRHMLFCKGFLCFNSVPCPHICPYLCTSDWSKLAAGSWSLTRSVERSLLKRTGNRQQSSTRPWANSSLYLLDVHGAQAGMGWRQGTHSNVRGAPRNRFQPQCRLDTKFVI